MQTNQSAKRRSAATRGAGNLDRSIQMFTLVFTLAIAIACGGGGSSGSSGKKKDLERALDASLPSLVDEPVETTSQPAGRDTVSADATTLAGSGD